MFYSFSWISATRKWQAWGREHSGDEVRGREHEGEMVILGTFDNHSDALLAVRDESPVKGEGIIVEVSHSELIKNGKKETVQMFLS